MAGFDDSKNECLKEFESYKDDKGILTVSVRSYNGGKPKLWINRLSANGEKYMKLGTLSQTETRYLAGSLQEVVSWFKDQTVKTVEFFKMEDEGKEYWATSKKLKKLFKTKEKLNQFKTDAKLKRVKSLDVYRCPATKTNKEHLTKVFYKALKLEVKFNLKDR